MVYTNELPLATAHTVHLCGFTNPQECVKEEAYPGAGPDLPCGISDAVTLAAVTGYFCEYIDLHTADEGPGLGFVMHGAEKLRALSDHAADVTPEVLLAHPAILHFEIMSGAMAPAPAPAAYDSGDDADEEEATDYVVMGEEKDGTIPDVDSDDTPLLSVSDDETLPSSADEEPPVRRRRLLRRGSRHGQGVRHTLRAGPGARGFVTLPSSMGRRL